MGVYYCGGVKKNVFEDKDEKKQIGKDVRLFVRIYVEVIEQDRYIGIEKV